MLQILVHGPWPFALLWRLYQCLRTLAEDVLNIAIARILVQCPRCRRTSLGLSMARTRALKHEGERMVLRECLHGCLSSKAVWAKMQADIEGDPEEQEKEEDSDSSEEAEQAGVSDARVKFDISGFALWLADLLPAKTPKKRAKVVNKAFEWAHAAKGKVQQHMVEHAWSLLAV